MRRFREILPLAARTATPSAVVVDVPSGAKGVLVVAEATAIVSTPSVTVAVRGVAEGTGAVFTLASLTALTAVGTQVAHIGPGLTSNVLLPEKLSILATHGDADSITYQVQVFFQ